jgi:hypothetical protein
MIPLRMRICGNVPIGDESINETLWVVLKKACGWKRISGRTYQPLEYMVRNQDPDYKEAGKKLSENHVHMYKAKVDGERAYVRTLERGHTTEFEWGGPRRYGRDIHYHPSETSVYKLSGTISTESLEKALSF